MDSLTVFGAKYLIFIVAAVAVIFTLLSPKRIRNDIIKLAIFSFPVAFLVAFIASHFYYDTRPFVVENAPPLIPHAPDNGFPSDHTLYAMVTAAIIFAQNRTVGISLAILAIFVGVSRIAASVHHPIDIVGSLAIAVVVTYAGWLMLKRMSKAQ